MIMGVSGAGKTTAGRELARRLGWTFIDADDHHPAENVARMRRGVPLTDEDRRPWLLRLRALLQDRLAAGTPVVLACSALKENYRALLTAGVPEIALVYLQASPAAIAERLRDRTGHFFEPSLLATQFATLEEPAGALTLPATAPPQALAERIARELGLDGTAEG